MGLYEWLFNKSATPEALTIPTTKEASMTFQEFTMKYRGAAKADGTPYLWPTDVGLVAAQTGLEQAQVSEWLGVWNQIQAAYVKNTNRMPTSAEIVKEYNLAHGIVEPVPPPVVTPPAPPVPTGRRFSGPFTAYVPPVTPPDQVRVGDLTVAKFEELMIHILGQVQPAQDDASARKLAAVLEALKQ